MNRWQRAWQAFWSEPLYKTNQQMRVFTDQSREWLDVRLAPTGVKLHLLTKDGVAVHGEVTDRTFSLQFHFMSTTMLDMQYVVSVLFTVTAMLLIFLKETTN
jgi:hypothetical protein